MGAGADETAESLNEQVQRLRTENVKLRELLDAMGVELPGLNDGGITGVADALVALMSEGGSLLREREELILEHARLTVAQQAADDQDPDLDRLLEALLEVDALNAEREQLRAEQGLHREEVDDFEDALTRLRPLLTETDSLRAERQRLTSERQSLVEAVEAVGMSAEEIICEDDRDLELQLLSAVKGVAVENESLKAKIQDLRAQISRQLMREALRLPAPPGRPVSVQLVTRAEAIPSSTRPLGIRSLIARGSGAVVARQRESRQSEVQLPEVRREAGRAELRQRLEEQERRLQQQLQEQAELQSQLQRHLEQEQQLQRELREQLEREIEDFNHLEELVTSASRGGVGASASAPAVFADAPQHPAPQETPSQVNSDFVEVPGVGPMSRQQLANLEALLNGDDAGTRAENLPDLSALSSTQLEHLEAQLSRGLVSSSTEATEPAESHVRGSNEEESVMPPQ
ncbi:unnamed protein product, partial [Durusdinium trenchii]